MTEKDLHDLRYINWRKESDFRTISQHEWNLIIDNLAADRATEIEIGKRQNTVRSAWDKADWSFSVSETEKVVKMYVSHLKNRGRRNQEMECFGYMAFKKEEKNNTFEKTHKDNYGTIGMNMTDEIFKAETGLSLRRAFGYIVSNETYNTIRYCAVAAPPLIYVEPRWVGGIYKHGYKADISSAYPDCLRGKLPDWHTVEIIPGRQEPTEEYPFVFWNDGHHAELGVYDTREFINNKWFLATNDSKKNKLNNFKNKGILVSYCCKASKYELTNTMMELYSRKENDIANKEYWKKLLVSFIGKTFENRNDASYPMPHLGAVCHGRQIKKMLDIAATLEAEGNMIISFATDSIIWCGKKSSTAVPREQKTLGSFVSEFEDAEFAFGGVGLYALKKGNTIGLIKHQGRLEDNFKGIKTLKQFLDVCAEKKLVEYVGYDKKTHKFIPKWRIS